MLAELNLLGQFRLRLSGGADIDLPSHKDRALLAILAGLGGGLAMASGDPPPETVASGNAGRVLAWKLGGTARLPESVPRPEPPLTPIEARIDPERSQRGKKLYFRHCAPCHGPSAVGGGFIPDLRRSALSFRSLESCLADTLGAQALFLDMTKTGESVGAGGGGYLDRSRVGLVAYEWETKPPSDFSQQLSGVLHEAVRTSATFGGVAQELKRMVAKAEQERIMICRYNITEKHQLNVLPFGTGGKR